MARPRTPTNVLELRGSNKKHPERARERVNEPEATTEISGPPAYLDDAQREAYVELVAKSHAGVLCGSDSVIVESAAILLARMRTKTDEFTAGEFARLQAVLGSLGMTPADRSKVKAPPKPAGNPFGNL